MNSTILDNQMQIWEMIIDAGPMVKLILLVLLAFSVISWAIIAYKLILLRKIDKETSAFYDLFWEKRQFAQIHAAVKDYNSTPLSSLFEAVYLELIAGGKAQGDKEIARICKDDIGRLQRILKKTAAVELSKMEYTVPFLATTGNTAPFIGLFGTVWGIMSSFRSIGARGAANLAVVAPGISEALVATAMGLVVAIPAVVGYNHIVSKISRISSEMDNFSSDLINIIEKQVTRT